MNTEMYQYMKDLHTFIEYQAQKLKKLEITVIELRQEIANLKQRPPLQVGNIEYKFDQLKVETLEGTLNIGLNPSDLEDVSDFTVDNKNIQVPNSPKAFFRETMEIENEVRDFIESELPAIYQSTKERLNFDVDDSYYQFIKEDILKQLPTRVQTHLQNPPKEEREKGENKKQEIIEKLKSEIQHGVYLFLDQLQKQTKGAKE